MYNPARVMNGSGDEITLRVISHLGNTIIKAQNGRTNKLAASNSWLIILAIYKLLAGVSMLHYHPKIRSRLKYATRTHLRPNLASIHQPLIVIDRDECYVSLTALYQI